MSEREHLKLIPINPFTQKQEDVINCVLEGATSREEIASLLYISEETVKKRIEGRKSIGIPGIYGKIESAYGIRPSGLYKAIGMMGGDIIISRIEKPNFQIIDLPNRDRGIEMQVDGKRWILFENRASSVAGIRAKRLHSFGLRIKADKPFDIKKSLKLNKLVSLVIKKGSANKTVGLYVELEKFDLLYNDVQVKKYLENFSFY